MRGHAWKLLPFWWIGYAIARWYLRSAWQRLRAKVEALRNAATPRTVQ